MAKILKRLVLSAAALCLVSCSSDSSDSTDSGSGYDLQTECGVVVRGSLENPVNSDQGQVLVAGAVVSSNELAIDTGTGPQLVRLHALGAASSTDDSPARALLSSLLSGGGYFFPAGENCSYTSSGGGVGTVGQILSGSGQSFTEELIRASVAGPIEGSGACSEELIAPCLQAFRAEVEAQQPPTVGTVRWFLWKPESDGGYNPGLLSILIDPCNVRVYVNGEELRDYGPTNGRCTTARSITKDGCDYGTNARVEVIDESTGLPYAFPDGKPYYIIPNGCQRVEFRV